MLAATPENGTSGVDVTRHYIRIGERQVHYRRAGTGAPVVLLHQSPKDSAELLPLMELLAANYTVFAPDTPGFGFSDPLRSADLLPSIDDFADALAALIDGLSLKRPAIFGTHSGAIAAVRLARRHPHKVSVLIANGILISDTRERQEYNAHYFPKFLPSWDGSHLSWLWSRLKDQHNFYPWYQRYRDNAIDWPATDADLAASTREFLNAGDDYRAAYRAVLDYDIRPDLEALTVQTQLLVARPDALYRYAEDYPPLPDNVDVCVVDDFADIPDSVVGYLKSHLTEPSSPPRPSAEKSNYGSSRGFCQLKQGQWHYVTAGRSDQPSLLVLHEPGSSAQCLRPLITALSNQWRIVAPDLPGHGQTEIRGAVSPTETARLLQEFIGAMLTAPINVVCFGATAAVGLELLKAPTNLVDVQQMVVCDPIFEELTKGVSKDRWLPDLTPEFAGAHLLRAWHFLRDKHLFFPWFERTGTQRLSAHAPSAQELQQQLIALLEADDALADRLVSFSAYPLQDYQQPSLTLAARQKAPCRRLIADIALLDEDPLNMANQLTTLLLARQ